jgi:hypothetical protein
MQAERLCALGPAASNARGSATAPAAALAARRGRMVPRSAVRYDPAERHSVDFHGHQHYVKP